MILIELEYPRELLVCIRMSSYMNYLYKIEYGRDIIDEIAESKEFERHDPDYLHQLFRDSYKYEFNKIEERVVNVFIQKP